MATNLSIDPDLIQQAPELSGERTKKAAVTRALQEFIARRRQKRLLDLVGKLEWDSSYDYKAERVSRLTLFVDTSVWSLALRRDAPSPASEVTEGARVETVRRGNWREVHSYVITHDDVMARRVRAGRNYPRSGYSCTVPAGSATRPPSSM